MERAGSAGQSECQRGSKSTAHSRTVPEGTTGKAYTVVNDGTAPGRPGGPCVRRKGHSQSRRAVPPHRPLGCPLWQRL